MSQLKENLRLILDEKAKLSPENIKDGVTYFGVTGSFGEGLDTSTLTATASDLAEGKIAYSLAGTIIGILSSVSDTQTFNSSEINKDDVNNKLSLRIITDSSKIYRSGTTIELISTYSDLASTIGVNASNILKGYTILGIEGTGASGFDTSDATAVETDIIQGKTAYINGGKITGSLAYTNSSVIKDGLTRTIENDGLTIKKDFATTTLYNKGSYLSYYVSNATLASLYNVTADKIVLGSSILGVAGNAKTAADCPQVYTTTELMNADTTQKDGTLGIIYDTLYEGTYIFTGGTWVQIGEPIEEVQSYNVLTDLKIGTEEVTEYEGIGGTEEEVNSVLDEILGNEEV